MSTNTNWQSYAGETTLSYFSQMVGLTVQNFLSAASGIAVIFALTRAFARQKVSTLGNAWVDLTRITLWILLPIALLIALFFIQQGSLQNLLPYAPYTSLEGAKQLLPMGPVASQEAIKMLRNERWRLLQCQLVAPVRKPDRPDQFCADAGDFPDPPRSALPLATWSTIAVRGEPCSGPCRLFSWPVLRW